MLVSVMQAINFIQQASLTKAGESIAVLALWFCYSLGSLLLKRLISLDYIVIDQQGIRLPYMLGNGIHVMRFTPWKSIERVEAIIPAENAARAKLKIKKKRGFPLSLAIKTLEPEFVEQFIMSARMWAPDKCDENLEQLQNVMRVGARQASALSYTDLWEDELGRRFCPTAYIPLEPGRGLRNSTIKIVSHLASGGLSALYLCQLDGKQLVVLKEAVIPQDGTEGVREKAKELFDREAKLLMKLDHPGIVHVLDCFSEGERNYLLLEYINGVDLRQLVRQHGVQKESDVLEWALQVANALKHLHEREQPIIHRDLTPDNIVLRNDGKVIIVDFGAANEFIGNATGTFVGKHSYIAPEQLRGKATVQSDIYAFGCTLFFLLTGSDPEALSPSNPNEYYKQGTSGDGMNEIQMNRAEMNSGAAGARHENGNGTGAEVLISNKISGESEATGKGKNGNGNGNGSNQPGAVIALRDNLPPGSNGNFKDPKDPRDRSGEDEERQQPLTVLTEQPAAMARTSVPAPPVISDELCELIQSCTQLEAADRYQTVAQLIPVLRRLSAQSIVV
jgi:serine/threonine protein kinase